MPSVAVVGGGISGLAAAFRLQQAGCAVRVFEADDYVGGRMATIEHEGYLLDTGAMVISSGYSRLLGLAEDAGLSAQLVPASSDMGFLKNGSVYRIRTDRPLDILSKGLLSPKDLFAFGRIGVDLFSAWRHLGTDDLSDSLFLDKEDLYDYARRRGISDEAIGLIIESMSMALWFEPSRGMSKLAFFWALRRVFGGAFLNSVDGMGFLPSALAKTVDVSLNAPVENVTEDADGVAVSWRGGSQKFDAAVIALPLPQVPSIYPSLDQEGVQLASKLEYASSMHVHFGLAAEPDETSSMIYSNPAENDGLGVTFLEHNKVPGRAPEGKGLITSYFLQRWCKDHWHRDDKEVLSLAEETLSRAYPGYLNSVDMGYVTRRPVCVVINKVGLAEAQVAFLRARANNKRSRIQLASDYFSCSSTESSLAKGEDAAQCLIEALL